MLDSTFLEDVVPMLLGKEAGAPRKVERHLPTLLGHGVDLDHGYLGGHTLPGLGLVPLGAKRFASIHATVDGHLQGHRPPISLHERQVLKYEARDTYHMHRISWKVGRSGSAKKGTACY